MEGKKEISARRNDKHARYTLRKFTSAPLRNSISIPIANIGIGAFEARSTIPKEKERATFDDKIEGNVNTPFFFFLSLSLLSRHFSLPFFSLFFSSSSFRPRPAQWFAWNKAWGSETSRRIRYVDMWESTSRRRTIGPTLIAILHRMLRNAPLHPDNLATLWYMNDVVVFHGHNALYFVNALQPTTKIFQNKWFFISSEFSILFFILELGFNNLV